MPLTESPPPQSRAAALPKRRVCAYCARAYSLVTRQVPTGANGRLDTDGVKLFCGEMAKRCADNAMQVKLNT